jgi:hypothetical protein
MPLIIIFHVFSLGGGYGGGGGFRGGSRGGFRGNFGRGNF